MLMPPQLFLLFKHRVIDWYDLNLNLNVDDY